ncbi:hypothetical protein VOLCADRAFT_87447 [Volvox carteri f. nagariensis]|uniref:Uncharacterized protein n=1 Tax=Volvox carteri f. nagariensis TaxID=3068 RepID=D8TLD0_VOLCA|nr:uncharacterized protein VOLCADRAFT_87447 [Volvox carteri f. nagariensis]EFJ51852.1 hypothetical protein VOLCADRAFT_87447 [Volvox carteri f. nagariensis]|eukprot:XP_002947262.1 hypothetical protein VOLCADRAFT_87447 [Volvox carteri f. nagariensis]
MSRWLVGSQLLFMLRALKTALVLLCIFKIIKGYELAPSDPTSFSLIACEVATGGNDTIKHLISNNGTWLQQLNAAAAAGESLPRQLLPPPTGRPGGPPAAPLLLFYRRDWWEALTSTIGQLKRPNATGGASAAGGNGSGGGAAAAGAPDVGSGAAAGARNASGMAAAAATAASSVPPTWTLFVLLLSDLLNRDFDGDGVPDHALCVDLMPGCKGGAVLAAIYASLAQTHGTAQGLWFNQTDFNPLLGIPPGALGVALLPGSDVVEFGPPMEGVAPPPSSSSPAATAGSGAATGSSDLDGRAAAASSDTSATGSTGAAAAPLDGLVTCTAVHCPYGTAVNSTVLEVAATAVSLNLQLPTNTTYPNDGGSGAAAGSSLYLQAVRQLPDTLLINRAPFYGERATAAFVGVQQPPVTSSLSIFVLNVFTVSAVFTAIVVVAVAGFAAAAQRRVTHSPDGPKDPSGGVRKNTVVTEVVGAKNLGARNPSLTHACAPRCRFEDWCRINFTLNTGSSRSWLYGKSVVDATATPPLDTEWNASMYGDIVVLSGVTRATPPTGEVTAADVAALLNADPRDATRLAQVIASAVQHKNAAMDIQLPYSSHYSASRAAWAVAEFGTISRSFPYPAILLRLYAHTIGAIKLSRLVPEPPSAPAAPQAGRMRRAAMIAGITAIAALVLTVVGCGIGILLWHFRCRRRRAKKGCGVMPGAHPNTTLVVTDVQVKQILCTVVR